MFAVINLPQFSLQAALRHEPNLWTKPVALVDPVERTPVIMEMTEAAADAGISVGLTPTQAMARCPSVLIRPRSPRQEEAASQTLLQCAYAFSPHLEATAPGVCTLDLRGLACLTPPTVAAADESAAFAEPAESAGLKAHLSQWAQKLQQSLAVLHLSAAVGLGVTPNVARQAARWGNGLQIVESPDAFMASLPVAALEPSIEVALILKRWGIDTVGEFLALGQEALAARLGLVALELVAAASSSVIRPLHLVQSSVHFEESYEYDSAIETLEPLLFRLRRFVDQLSLRLEVRGLVAESIELHLGLESGQKLVSRLRIPQPTRQPDVLFRTLHTHLETLRTESAVKAVGLTIVPSQAEQKQLGLFETVLCNPLQFQETLARLAAVLGSDRVGTPALENSHRPDAYRLVPPDFECAPITAPNSRPALPQGVPLRRFRPPLKAEVEWNHHIGPISIRCSIAQGKLRLVVGPWRASGKWWEPSVWEQEEWDATTADGKVLRLAHRTDGWYVEGVVD